MKIALVHDWLTGYRGGEKILEILCELLPQSDLYTIIHVPGSTTPRIEQRRIISSWLSRLPGVKNYYRWLLPLMPSAASSLRLEGYDLVFAISHSVAHGVTVAEGTRFIVYCNTPMRYAWRTLENYFPGKLRIDPRYWLLRTVRSQLQAWDRKASTKPAEYIANSRNIAARIHECYGRESDVIYPPVDTDFYQPMDTQRQDFYLWAGALAPYKRMDIAMDAFRILKNPLVVIGNGQQLRACQKRAPENIHFLGWQPDEVLRRHYSTCKALIFPGEEDFGIVPLEAQACGAPVVAYGKGGSLETVLDAEAAENENNATGVFFRDPDAESLAKAVLKLEAIYGSFNKVAIRQNALKFDRVPCTDALKTKINLEI